MNRLNQVLLNPEDQTVFSKKLWRSLNKCLFYEPSDFIRPAI